MKMFIRLMLGVCLVGITASCGGGNESKQENKIKLSIKAKGEMPESLKVLNNTQSALTSDEMRQYLLYDPLVSSRCIFPESEDFKTASDAMGGFSHPYRIPVAEDDTNPRVLSGFEEIEISIADASESPTIIRPDLVAQSGDYALYLSQPLGLFMVHVNRANPIASTLSCATTIPGHAQNFIMKDNQVLVLVNSLDGKSGAVFQYRFENEALVYQSSFLLTDKPIVDARLFNNTLAIYSQNKTDNNEEESYGSALTRDMAAPSFYYEEPKSYALTVVDTSSLLSLVSTDDLLYEEEKDDTGIVDQWTRYNDFVAAADDYLVVSRTHNEKVIDHYETGIYQECKAYREETREVCHIEWERVPNPDYVERGSTLSCRGSLLECLSKKGPTLSRYIYVNAGTKCEDITYQVCTRYVSHSITYPVYRDDLSTRFTVYRFKDGDFIRLDDSLSVLNGTSIALTSDPIEIKGQVDHLSRLYFNKGFFYALSSDKTLTTFSISGNSVIKTSLLEGIGGTDENISASLFSPETLYVNTSAYGSYLAQYDYSLLHTISLVDPINPALSSDVSLAGELSQMFVLDNQLLAFGTTFYGAIPYRQNMGTINLFSSSGSELDALLLGTDLENYYSTASYDDQAARVDGHRILLPYTSSGFKEGIGYQYKNRLQIAEINGENIDDIASFDLSAGVKRSLNFSSNLAMSFSDYLITMLYKTDSWQSGALLNIRLPNKVYEAIPNTYWIRSTLKDGSYNMAVVAPDSIFSETPLDFMSVPQATTHVCRPESLYFAGTGFILASEIQGAYATRDDCDDVQPTDIQLRGWHVDENGSWQETDQLTLENQYALILADYQCVVDPTLFTGKVLDVETLPDDVSCYTQEEYQEIRWSNMESM